MTAVRESAGIRRWALPGLLFALLVVAVYSPPFLSRENFVGRDLLVYNLPIEKIVHDSWSRGSVPVWTSEISGGRPLAANPNSGVFYPVRPLLALLPFPAAMRIYPVLHWVAAGLGMLLLVRALGGSRSAAWVGAVTYAFSGVAVSEVFYPNYQPGMTLLPWIVWAVARRGVPAINRLLLLSVLFGLLIFAGDVFTTGAAIAAGALWIVLEGERSERARDFSTLGLALLLAGLLAAPQWVATALWVPDTNRAILGMPLSDAFTFSVSPLRLLELVMPYPFGPTWSLDDSKAWGWPAFGGKTIGFFTTLYAGTLAVIALGASWKWRPAGARFARWLFLVALAAAVLPSFLPKAWGGILAPVPLRFPEKFAVAIALSLAILSALVFDRLRGSARLPRWGLAVGAVLLVLAGAAFLAPDRAAPVAVRVSRLRGTPPKLPEAPADPVGVAKREVPSALAEGALLWMATLAALAILRRPGKTPLAAALVLLTAIPIASNRRITRTLEEETVFEPPAFARLLQENDPDGRYRTLGESFYRDVSAMQIKHADLGAHGMGESGVQYRQALYGRGTVFNFDFDAGDSARMESLRRISSVLVDRPGADVLFGGLALRYGVRFRDQEPVPGYERIGGTALQDWDELAAALPDVRLAESWREAPGPLEAARALPGLAAGEVLIESGVERRGRARPGELRLTERTARGFRGEADVPDPTWLFVLRGFSTFRDVRVDGRVVETFPAQLAFSAVFLPAGRHTIEWKERLAGVEVSRWGPAVFALLVAGLFLRDRRRRA